MSSTSNTSVALGGMTCSGHTMLLQADGRSVRRSSHFEQTSTVCAHGTSERVFQ